MTTFTKPKIVPNVIRSTYTDPDGFHVFMSSNTVRNLSISDSKVVIKNPNWQKEIASGSNATTPYTKIVQTYNPCVIHGTCSGYQDIAHKRPFTAQVSASWHPYDPSYDVVRTSANADAIAITRLKQKLRSQAGMVSAAVPLVELRELRSTIHGIANSTIALLYDLIQLRKRSGWSKRQAKLIADDAAQLWLNFGFGVSPTIADANAIIGAIETRIREPAAIRVSALGKETSRVSRKDLNGILYGCSSLHTTSTTREISYRYTAGSRLLVNAQNSYDVASDFGLNFSALPSIAWELTVFSWVVDYFVNVGSYFDETFSGQVPLSYLSKSVKVKCSSLLEATFIETTKGNTPSGFGSGNYEYFEFTRSKPSLTLPPAVLRFKTVDQAGKNAVNKVLNLASVLVTRRHYGLERDSDA